jgi:hypothetical protein
MREGRAQLFDDRIVASFDTSQAAMRRCVVAGARFLHGF